MKQENVVKLNRSEKNEYDETDVLVYSKRVEEKSEMITWIGTSQSSD